MYHIAVVSKICIFSEQIDGKFLLNLNIVTLLSEITDLAKMANSGIHFGIMEEFRIAVC